MNARCFTTTKFLLFILLRILSKHSVVLALRLTTSSTIPNIRRSDLHDFLATPSHWPEIVLSSHSVKRPSFATPNNRVDIPLKEGDYVEEVFGLPPLLPLAVVWQCVKSDVMGGSLEFYSEGGVPGLAKECKMIFDIREEEDPTTSLGRNCKVDLTMEFEPRNPIIPLGVPFLAADNTVALKVLLPRAVKR